jgi:hypothetical protein
VKLIVPTKAYRSVLPKKGKRKAKWHLLKESDGRKTICGYWLFEANREEKDIADLWPKQLCKMCWRFGTEDERLKRQPE